MFKFRVTHQQEQIKRTWWGERKEIVSIHTTFYSKAESFDAAAKEAIAAYPEAIDIVYIVR